MDAIEGWEDAVNENTQDLLEQCKGAILSIEPDAEIVLYGSYARNEQTAESDLDLLVLLPGEPTIETKLAINEATHPIQLDRGVLIVCLIKSKQFWRDVMSITPLYEAIEEEGIAV